MYEPINLIVRRENEKRRQSRRKENLYAALFCLSVAAFIVVASWWPVTK